MSRREQDRRKESGKKMRRRGEKTDTKTPRGLRQVELSARGTFERIVRSRIRQQGTEWGKEGSNRWAGEEGKFGEEVDCLSDPPTENHKNVLAGSRESVWDGTADAPVGKFMGKGEGEELSKISGLLNAPTGKKHHTVKKEKV